MGKRLEKRREIKESRTIEVMRLLGTGMSRKEVANQLGIGYSTVSCYVYRSGQAESKYRHDVPCNISGLKNGAQWGYK